MIAGFIIWAAVGLLFVGIGIYARFAQKPVGFWANQKMFEVTDVRAYNRAVGKMFIVFGGVFVLLGLPILAGQNSPWAIISVIGVVFEIIALMAVYTTVIEGKYKKK